jgi:hypothetical protein
MPCSYEKPVFIDGQGWFSYQQAREVLRLNFQSPLWSDIEAEIVDTCDTLAEAWELYQAAFGTDHRPYTAIKRRWYRSHQKVRP